MFGHIVNLLVQRLDGFERGGALRSHGQAHHAGMIEGGSDSAADGVGQPLLGADGAEQAGGKAAAEGFIKDADGVVVGIVAPDAEPTMSIELWLTSSFWTR